MYVYVIGTTKDQCVKIGYSSNVESRMRQLQIGNPHKLRVILKIEVARECEQALHRYFAHQRMCGEWFDFSGDDVCFEIARALHEIHSPDNIYVDDDGWSWDFTVLYDSDDEEQSVA